jgi:hypothetical protein
MLMPARCPKDERTADQRRADVFADLGAAMLNAAPVKWQGRRLVTDPLGRLVRCGTETYRPPAALRDHVIAQHATCTFFGCRRQGCRGELDHVIPWPAQPGTVAENLQPSCKRHHDVKHHTEWTVHKREDGVTWISPTGREYLRPVHAYPVDHPRLRRRPRPTALLTASCAHDGGAILRFVRGWTVDSGHLPM